MFPFSFYTHRFLVRVGNVIIAPNAAPYKTDIIGLLCMGQSLLHPIK